VLRNFLGSGFRIVILILALGALILVLPRLITGVYSLPRVYNTENVPAGRVAIVFGAGLWRDGSPTPVLRDRVAAAARLYFNGKVEKLLMSGDNSDVHHNEPGAMLEYALSLGVPQDAVVLDYAGRRTYDTCYRARVIFGVEKAILVTQGFHLPRALFLCNVLGVPAVGVSADLSEYRQRSEWYWHLREVPATFVALWDVYISRPQPILGNPEPIFPNTEAQ
jgi:SanA protein